jgi:penicillin-binding protein activator
MKRIYLLPFVFPLLLFLSGCGPNRYLPAGYDVSGRWNDDDARFLAIELVEEALNHPRVMEFENRNQRVPVLIVADVKDIATEEIDVEYFMLRLERKLLNSGNVRVIRGSEFRDFLREETGEENPIVSADLLAKWKRELGADFMFTGTMNSREQRRRIDYIAKLQLTNLHSGERVWTGQRKLRKRIP